MDNKFYKILGKRQIPDMRLQKTAYQVNSASPLHSHENARFVFVLQGKFTEKYEQKKRDCRSMTMIIRPPLEKHSEDYDGKGIICLSVDIQAEWMQRLREHNVLLDDSAEHHSANLSSLIIKLNYEFDAQDKASALAVEALLLEIAVEVSREKEKISSDNKVPSWLSDARDFIHSEFTLNPTIKEIADASYVHPVHLSRVFQRQYHCTIAEYIRRLRVELSCTALAKSNESLANIALKTGFSDQSHFSKIFKRIMNVTPSEYRTLMRSR